MKQDDFFKRLDEHLADLQVSSPNDLWEGIEASLESQGLTEGRNTSRLVSLKRWAVAAVTAGLVFGAGYLFWPNQTKESRQTAAASDNVMKSEETKQEPAIIASTTAQEVKAVQVVTKQSFVTNKAGVSRQGTLAQEVTLQEEGQKEAEIQEEQPQTHDGRLTFPASVRQATAFVEKKKVRHNRLSLGLYAGGGMSNLNVRNGVEMSAMLLGKYATARTRSSTVYLADYEEQQYHRQPISFGLSLDYQLNRRLSLSTGVVYTKLYSEFTSIMRGDQIQREQTLHYVGIPLNLNVGIWQYKGLRTYLSAGGQIDFNVKADMNTGLVRQTMDKDRPNISVAANLGIQYSFLPQFSIYAEPGIRHYFDNGSQVRNFFKEKPTSFNLQLGIRYSLNR